MTYKIIDFKSGKYNYDTLFIEDDNGIIQIPIKKNIFQSGLIGEEIEIKNLYTPIEEI